MRRVIAIVGATAFAFGTSLPAAAEGPHELWGYSPTQTAEDALSVDTSRRLDNCSFTDTWKCITFAKNLFGYYAKVYVQFGANKRVRQIAINAMVEDQTERVLCSRMASEIVWKFREIYGQFVQSSDKIKFSWRSGPYKFELTALCLADDIGGLVGGLTIDR